MTETDVLYKYLKYILQKIKKIYFTKVYKHANDEI